MTGEGVQEDPIVRVSPGGGRHRQPEAREACPTERRGVYNPK